MKIKVGVSNHHVHLTKEVLEILFGSGYELTVKRELLQKGQYACEETVSLKKGNKRLDHIRIIGPCRDYTQVEILKIDNEFFEMNAPCRKSKDLIGSETITIIGPKGEYEAIESTIIADKHIHMSQKDLEIFNVNNNDIVCVKTKDNIIIKDVHIKSDKSCTLEMHINKDEAQELKIDNDSEVEIC